MGDKLSNISTEKRKQTVQYMMEDIKHVITTYGDRDPGSEGERKAQFYYADQLKPLTDNVVVEDFKLNPGAFFGWIPFTVIMVLIGFALYFVAPIFTIVAVIIAIIPMVSQLILYTKLTDKFYKEKTSCNVTATKKPTGEVKRRVVLNGHTDATWEWTINYKLGGVGFTSFIIIAIAGIFILSILSLVNVFTAGAIGWATGWQLYAGAGLLIFLPFWLGFFFFSNSKVVVPGANDNLTANYMGVGLLKLMQEEGIELENTEIVVMLSGSEEAGLRGSKAWVDAHKDDYKDVETVFLAFETLREIDHLTIYARDLNGLLPVDKQACALFKKAGQAVGIDIKYGAVTIGATDAAAFTQGGFKAACLGALNHNLQDYYHTRYDNYDNLSKECLEASFNIALAAVEIFDKEGLDKSIK